MFFNGLASARQYARAAASAVPPGAMPLPRDPQLRQAGNAKRPEEETGAWGNRQGSW